MVLGRATGRQAADDGGGKQPSRAPIAPADTGGERSRVVVLAGGTGGAKLARGMLDVVGADELAVIANTGDDIDIYGAHVSPDADLVSFWLADLIDERGWGLRGDTFNVMDALRQLGVDVWFNLGDRDLAWCLERKRMQEQGMRATEALRALTERIGVRAQVLPMSDEPLRTWVRTAERGWRQFQEFMIRDRCQGAVEAVEFRSDEPSSPSAEALATLAHARAMIVGPSNPVISIWPILAVLSPALTAFDAPVVCVSPVVGGEIVKGPTAEFLSSYGQPLSATGVAAFYERVQPGLLDGMVCDEPLNVPPAPRAMPTLRIDTRMDDPAARARVAERTLSFALSLGE